MRHDDSLPGYDPLVDETLSTCWCGAKAVWIPTAWAEKGWTKRCRKQGCEPKRRKRDPLIAAAACRRPVVVTTRLGDRHGWLAHVDGSKVKVVLESGAWLTVHRDQIRFPDQEPKDAPVDGKSEG